MMKTLSILGTLAMFLVGGGILAHGVPPIHNAIHHFAVEAGGPAASVIPMLANGLLGVLVGALLVAVITPLLRVWEARSEAS